MSSVPDATSDPFLHRPEVLLQGRQWAPFFHENPFSYDSWSIGVVVSADCTLDSSIYCCVPTHAVCLQALELLLGSPNVFSVDQRTKALLTNRLRKEGASERDIQRGLYLAGKLSLVICGWDPTCLLYTSPSPRDRSVTRMPSSA